MDPLDALGGRRPEAVLNQQPQIVPLSQELDLHSGKELPQQAHLAVLVRHQVCLQRGELDVRVDVGEIEVGGEGLH